MSLARSLVGRVRRGIARRASRILDQLDLAPHTPGPVPAPAPVPRVSPFATGGAAEVAASPVHPATPSPEPAMTFEQVQELFEDMVRPALQSDGGDIELLRVESNDVYVRLQGACTTCSSSVVTMRMGIERLLKEEFPHFGQLVEVTGGA